MRRLMRLSLLLALVLSVALAAAAALGTSPTPTEAKERDHYEVLGVARNADEAAIKKAYRKQAKKYHPDRYSDPKKKEQAEKLFVKVAKAYETLSDPEKRRMYDLGGDEQVNEAEQRRRAQEAYGAVSYTHLTLPTN